MKSTMTEESNQIHEVMMAKFLEMLCVSLAIDTGTAERRHFPHIKVLAPSLKIIAFFSDAFERATLTAEDYGTIVMAAIRQLYQKNVNVRLIVRDNLPAQVTALAHRTHDHV
jgi:hypothetical protein